MSKASKVKASGPVEAEGFSSTSGARGDVIAHAYAIVPVAGKVGKYRALHLQGVIAEIVTDLEPEGRGEPATTCLSRIDSALNERTRRKAWTRK